MTDQESASNSQSASNSHSASNSQSETVTSPAPAAVAAAEPQTLELETLPTSPEPTLNPEPVVIAVADEAPLAPLPSPEPVAAAASTASTESPSQLLGLPLQLVNQLLARLGATPLQSLAELMPAVRIVTLLVVAGVAVKLTGATLGAINDIPMVGRLLELVGLISALNFLARNAIRSQKRAELLARIQKLKRDLLG